MEERKKKIINSNYGILVILLFAMVCTLTDWIIIERKVRVCECPKCESTSNEVINGNTDNTQVVENKSYSYEDIAGRYEGYPVEVGNDTIVSSITLYPDGTYSYGYLPALHTVGNYIIEDNKIYMNDILSVGSDPQMHVLNSERTLIINSDGTFIDENANIKPGQTGLDEVDMVKYVRDNEYQSTRNSFDDAMNNLNKFYIERNYD